MKISFPLHGILIQSNTVHLIRSASGAGNIIKILIMYIIIDNYVYFTSVLLKWKVLRSKDFLLSAGDQSVNVKGHTKMNMFAFFFDLKVRQNLNLFMRVYQLENLDNLALASLQC